MILLPDIAERVRAKYATENPKMAAVTASTYVIEDIVRLTVEALGGEIADTGAISVPRHAPVPRRRLRK